MAGGRGDVTVRKGHTCGHSLGDALFFKLGGHGCPMYAMSIVYTYKIDHQKSLFLKLQSLLSLCICACCSLSIWNIFSHSCPLGKALLIPSQSQRESQNTTVVIRTSFKLNTDPSSRSVTTCVILAKCLILSEPSLQFYIAKYLLRGLNKKPIKYLA